MAQNFGPPPDERPAFGPPPDEIKSFGPPPDEVSNFGPPPDEVKALPDWENPAVRQGLTAAGLGVNIPFLAPASKYVKGLVGRTAEFAGKMGVPSPVTAAALLPAGVAADLLPENVGDVVGLLAASAIPGLPKSLPKGPTPLQAETLARALKGAEAAGAAVTKETLGTVKAIPKVAPVELGQFSPLSRLAVQEKNLQSAIISAGRSGVSLPAKVVGEVPLEISFPTQQVGTLGQELRKVVEVSKKAIDQGVKPQAILTESERALYSKFENQIKSAIEFRVPVESLISAEESAAFKAAHTKIATAVAPETAELVAPKLATLPEAEVTRASNEMVAAATGPNPLVKPIVDVATPENASNLLERAGRPRIEAEHSLLGLKQSTEVWRQSVNELILKRQAGLPLSQEEGKMVSQVVAEAIGTGEVSPQSAFKMLGLDLQTDMGRKAAYDYLMDTSSQFGYGLAQVSRAQREMLKVFQKDPSMARYIAELRSMKKLPEESTWSKAMDAYRYVDNIRRAAMVSGVGTFIRNSLSQGERLGAQVFEDAVSGVLASVRGKNPGAALDNAMIRVTSALGQMSKAGRAELDTLLAKFPLEGERLLNAPMGDVTLDKSIASFLNTMNTFQEKYYRRAAFDAFTKQTAEQTGRTVAQLTEKEVSQAVQHALEMTYSASPKSGLGRAVLNLYKEAPFLTAIGNPFPRFWMNALKRMWDLMPTTALMPENLAKLASSDPRVAGQAISRSLLGSTYLAAGYGLAEMGAFGEKWYELKKDGITTDMRPYYPVVGPVAFGRMLHDVNKEGAVGILNMTPEDWVQMALSMKRTDVMGMPAIEILQARDPKEIAKVLLRTAESYATSFVPRILTTARDVAGVFNKGERTPRYTKGTPILGSIMAQVPFWGQMLPEAASPLRAGPEERAMPGLRALGFTTRIKTPAEAEADRLGVRPRNIYPRSGLEAWDRAAVELMGPFAQGAMEQLMASKAYMKQDKKMKKAIFEGMVMGLANQFERATMGKDKNFTLYNIKNNGPKMVQEMISRQFEAKGIEVEE